MPLAEPPEAHTTEKKLTRVQKLSFDEVANRIWAETKTPVLVYATEHALNVEKMPLGSSLERFVKADNKSFRSELQQESSTTETSMEVDAEGETNDEFFAPSDMLRSPPKRKHRSDSVDSMASNRASMGSRDGSDDAGQEAASVLQSISVADGAGAAQAHDPFTGLKGDMDRMRVAAEQAAAQAQKFATAQQVDSVPPPAYEPPPLPERRAADAGEKSGYGAAPGPEMQEKQSTSVLQRLPSQGEGKGLDMDMADD